MAATTFERSFPGRLDQSHDPLELNADAFRDFHPAPYSPRTPTSTDNRKRYFAPLASPKSTDHVSINMTKGRPRGESDLGRPTLRSRNTSGNVLHEITLEEEVSTPAGPSAHLEHTSSLPIELLTSILIPLPYLLGSLVRPLTAAIDHSKHSAHTEAAEEILEEVASTAFPVTTRSSSLFDACALASCTLLVVGLLGRYARLRENRSRSRSNSKVSTTPTEKLSRWGYWKRLLLRMAMVGLPFLATVEIGGVRTGLFILAAAAEGLIAPESKSTPAKPKSWRNALVSHKWLCGLFTISMLLDLFVLQQDTEPSAIVRGYAALVKTVFLLQSPLPTPSGAFTPRTVSPLISSIKETTMTVIAGGILGAVTLVLSWLLSSVPQFDISSFFLFILTVSATAAMLSLAQPSSLRSLRKPGTATGLVLCAAFGITASPLNSNAFALSTLLCGLAYFIVQVDTRNLHAIKLDSSAINDHRRNHSYSNIKGSRFTQFLLRRTEDWPLLHSILADKDSRRIAYFMVINLAFMFVQTFYSVVSGSLGLLSDSIHMLFDCVGLLAGLVAAIMSKWPPNAKFPYGYGKVEVLSGLGNGIFLMIISVEIIWESFERVMEGAELKHMDELLLVSIGGLLVNLIGLMFTGHHHHGHSHGGHSHHDHSHEHLTSANGSAEKHVHATSHGHDHTNENMAGIYLHILADTMGSVAVIVSTLLTKYTGWMGWDPVASCVIAVLIIAASIPLVVGSAKQLLLTMPNEMEYSLRTTLQGISDLRGVIGYAVPRFWLEEGSPPDTCQEHGHDSHDHVHLEHHAKGEEKHAHEHEHEHEHTHSHSHDRSHGHNQSHSQSHSPGHTHGHHQSHSKSHSPSHSHSHTQEGHELHDHHDHGHSTPHSHAGSLDEKDDVGHEHDNCEAVAHGQRLLGVIHIIASPRADMEDVRQRVDKFLRARGMNVLVHVEKEGQSRCWCGGASLSAHGKSKSVVVM